MIFGNISFNSRRVQTDLRIYLSEIGHSVPKWLRTFHESQSAFNNSSKQAQNNDQNFHDFPPYFNYFSTSYCVYPFENMKSSGIMLFCLQEWHFYPPKGMKCAYAYERNYDEARPCEKFFASCCVRPLFPAGSMIWFSIFLHHLPSLRTQYSSNQSNSWCCLSKIIVYVWKKVNIIWTEKERNYGFKWDISPGTLQTVEGLSFYWLITIVPWTYFNVIVILIFARVLRNSGYTADFFSWGWKEAIWLVLYREIEWFPRSSATAKDLNGILLLII